MKKSKYGYFFKSEDEYIGYSWLTGKYVAFALPEKPRVDRVLNYPDNILTNRDNEILSELQDKFFIIPDSFDEYAFLIQIHREEIYRKDRLSLTILPTMFCNLRCVYCYESHAIGSEVVMSPQVVNSLKKYVNSKVNDIKILNLTWFGGEPLVAASLMEDFSRYCKELCEKNNITFYNSMSTNICLLTEPMAATLSELQLRKAQVTIDGYKENHDKMRKKINGQGTFDEIIRNMGIYLDAHKDNFIYLRIHFPPHADENYLEKTVQSLEAIPTKYRDRIFVYSHVLFVAQTDIWCSDIGEKYKKTGTYNSEKIFDRNYLMNLLSQFRNIMFNKGFNVSNKTIFKKRTYCEADFDSHWNVLPDGHLTKCTIAVDKERAQAILIDGRVKYFSTYNLEFKKKDFSDSLFEACKECIYLPFCWRGCAFTIRQDQSVDKFLKNVCSNAKDSWLFQRKLDDIKYYYLEQKRSGKPLENLPVVARVDSASSKYLKEGK